MTGIDAYRLPRNLRPVRYDLALAPDLDGARFDGNTSILFDVVESTDTVVLNAAELDITAVVVFADVDGPVYTVRSFGCDDDLERLTINLVESLPVGPITVEISYRGTLNDRLRGFYRSTYNDDDGNEHTIAITQFESTNARRAFPCVDEPDAKAIFGITLTTAAGLTAISCTDPISEITLSDGRRRTTYADTMLMPTYIVAFVVGELEMTEPVMVGTTPIRIVYPPGKAHLTDFAIQAAVFSLTWLEEYYDSPYPGDKLDLIAAPDFAFGAMENLGCVTFRETLLLADPATATASELMRMADVIAHELAHMWFGNLVTMAWWEGIWLKEAFATFMEMAIVNTFKPEWRRWEQFSRDRAPAFAVDSLSSTRAIEFPVFSPDEAEAMYDVLTYEKGAAVVRMLEQFMGEDRFRDGIRHYLKSHAYGNTVTTDLWDALEASSGDPVRSIMDSWIYQAGHPLVEVTRTDVGVTLSQNIFRFDGSGERIWNIPMSLRVRVGGHVVEQTLVLTEARTELDLGGTVDWVVANTGANGFYRVRYGADLHRALVRQAQEILSATERAALADDLIAAVIAGSAPALAIVELAEEFVYETDLGVWRSIAGGLALVSRLVDGDAYQRFQIRVGRVATTALDILGTEAAEGEDALTSELRALLFRTAGTLGADARVGELAQTLFAGGPNGPGSDPQLFAAAVAVIAERGDDDMYAEFDRRQRTAATPQDQVRYLTNLASFPSSDQMLRTLDACRTEVRSQNAPFVVAACLAHRDHGPLVWAYVRDHWGELTERFPSNSISRMLSGITAMTDQAVADDIVAFVGEHPIPQGGATVDQYLERMQINLNLRHREAHQLAQDL